MALVDIGTKAPGFRLADQDGAVHSLEDYAGRMVVLYFYPRDDTSGCTREACAFRDNLPKFTTKDVAILGVSPDDVQSHERFAAKFNLPFPLLADVPNQDGLPTVCSAYGVWQQRSMYGRKYMGVVRTTYLIDGDGRVAQRWDKVNVAGHAQQVLAEAEKQELNADN